MRRLTLAELVVVSILLASATSAATCIIPRELSRAVTELHEKPTPEAEEAVRQASGWPIREHAMLAAVLSIPFAVAIGFFNLALAPPRP